MGLARDLRSRRVIPLREVVVPAWANEDGVPFTLYCGPISCYDLDQLQKKHPKFLENTTTNNNLEQKINRVFSLSSHFIPHICASLLFM